MASVIASLARGTAMRFMLLDSKTNGEFAARLLRPPRLLRNTLRGARGAPRVVLTALPAMQAERYVSDGARWWPAG